MQRPSLDTSLWLDLNEVDALHRLHAWRTWLQASFPEFSLLSTAEPDRGSARVLSLGSARLWLLHCPAGMTLRAAPAVQFQRDAFVSFQLQGTRTVARDGRVFRIEAGQLCMGRASTTGAETTYDSDTRMLLLEMPSTWLRFRHPQAGQWNYHVCRSDQPGAALLHDLLARTLAVGERLEDHERRLALSAAVELLPLPIVGLRSRDAHFSRVEHLLYSIDERLSEPRLNAEQLANEHGISRRRLDELFVSVLGSPVAACIAQRRLTRAAKLLRDPTCSELSVASVAAAVGFSDASHFARAFRRRFGVAPSAWRADEYGRLVAG